MIEPAPQDTSPHPDLRGAIPTWARIAALSFGGPAGQIAVMQRILVDEKRWISQERFLHALNFCMLLPGPEAQQLATYVGWLMHRWRGGLIAGGLFVLPGFVAILALSVAYALWRDAPLVAGILFGIKPAVLAVVVEALIRIGRRALHGPFALAIAALAFIGLYLFAVPFPLVILAAGLIGVVATRLGVRLIRHSVESEAHPPGRPSLALAARTAALWLAIWWLPVAALWLALGGAHTLVREAVFFSQAAVVTFGGAYAVLAYIAQEAVDTFGWLRPGEMLDGLGMAETTPGPLIMVVEFVGFMGAYRNAEPFTPLVAGVLGAVVTTWVTFAPCFMWIFTGAPYVEYLRGRPALAGALAAITAAVVGVILNLSVWFAVHTLFARTREVRSAGLRMDGPVLETVSWPAVAIAAMAFLLLFRLRIGMLQTLGIAAVAGALWTLFGA